MQAVAAIIDTWRSQRRRGVLARVIGAEGLGPRAADEALVIGEDERLHGPAGLDIGPRTPEETALSIVAEIVASRTSRQGAPLRTTTGRISG